MDLSIIRVINNPITSNCFIIFDKRINNKCIIVDPGSEDNVELYKVLNQDQLEPQYIVLTHQHFDHIWGVNSLRDMYDEIKVICNKACDEMIIDSKKNCSLFYNQEGFIVQNADILTDNLNDDFVWNGYKIIFFSTPGHSTSCICFTIEDNLFTGDTLIKDEKTVTKLPSGNKIELRHSIQRLNELKGHCYTVRAGHGDSFKLDQYELEKAL